MSTIRSGHVNFEGSQGAALAGRLEMPAGEPLAWALFAHCFTCGKDSVAASRISRALAELGIAVLRFDFTGLGSSDGDFASTNFSSNVGDLVRAADWLRDNHSAPAILIGHSLGGAGVLAAAARIPESVAVATIGAPGDPSHVSHLLGEDIERIRAEGEVEVSLGGRRFRIRRQFLDDISESRLEPALRELGKALLIMHSPVDDIVNVDNARRLYEAARHPKSFVSLDDADHLLRRRRDADYVARVLAAWVSRYLEERPATAQLADVRAPEGEVVVSEAGDGRFAQHVLAGRHHLRGDEPESAGGGDTGPTPYGYLLAALGTCTSMTLRMYAERRKLPLERVTVRLSHDRIHAADCEDCETREGRVDEIRRSVLLEGDLDEAAREKLLEIADKCPVHRTLTTETKIRTRLAE